MGRDEAAVGRLLDEALRRMDRRMVDPLRSAGQPIGFVLPVVERIDAVRVPEFFWREVTSRQASDNPRANRLDSPSAVIPYLASYDREVDAALFEPTRVRIERADDHELATWAKPFVAWSHFDPRGAANRLEKVPVRHDPSGDANAARLAVAASLRLSDDQRLWTLWSYREYVLELTGVTPFSRGSTGRTACPRR
jgi:hypothetical protein